MSDMSYGSLPPPRTSSSSTLERLFSRLMGWLVWAMLAALGLVINATSAGLHGEHLPLPAGLFAPGALAYDMVYGGTETPFLKDARALGAERVSDGLGMLVGQAAESFFLWRGVRPDIGPVLKSLQGG